MANFRETNWFKRGELVVEGDPDEQQVELPIEDRYLDDGGTTCTDTALYGVHTGETTPIPSMKTVSDAPELASSVIACDPQSAPDLQQLIRELKARNRTILAMCGAAVLVVAVFVSGAL